MRKTILVALLVILCVPLLAGAQVFGDKMPLPVKTPGQKLKQLKGTQLPSLKPFQQPPKDIGGGLDKHLELIQLQLDHLDSSQIPEDKRDMVRAELEAELAWAQAMQDKVDQAETEEEKQTLQEEVTQHITQIKEERRQRLSQAAKLPDESPFNKAEDIGERFGATVSKLEEQGEDVAQLRIALDEYVTAVAQGQELFADTQQNKTYEQLVALRDQLQIVREKGGALRNLLQSLLESAPLDSTNS